MRRHLFVLLLAPLVAATPAGAAGRSGGILPGASAKDPLNIDAGKLDFFEKEQKLIYSGSVIVTNGPSTLKASRLIIFLEGKGARPARRDDQRPRQTYRRRGPGDAGFQGPDRHGRSGQYDKAENKVYLIGNVTLTQGENIVKGDRLVYDVTSGVATVQGGAQQGGACGDLHPRISNPGSAEGVSFTRPHDR